MSSLDVKGDLHDYLRGARETLVWKLDGLGEYDVRRPLTPTGTNLLGLVKHNAGMELMYFIRESIDGSAGFLSGHDSLRISDPASWKTFHDRIEEAARLADASERP